MKSFKSVNKVQSTFKKFYSTKPKRIGVILSGSGVYDGSEIHEAVSVLVHLSRHNVETKFYAIDGQQAHVINHLKGADAPEKRNILVESARIARGNIEPITAINVDEIDAFVMPGGFGAAKNNCSFAFDGANMTVHPQIENLLRTSHSKKKLLAFCCIAPVIPAKVLAPCEVTIGSDEGVSKAIEKFGSKNINTSVSQFHYDSKNRILTTPAYMIEGAKPHEIYDGIGNMINKLITLI